VDKRHLELIEDAKREPYKKGYAQNTLRHKSPSKPQKLLIKNLIKKCKILKSYKILNKILIKYQIKFQVQLLSIQQVSPVQHVSPVQLLSIKEPVHKEF
jgi:hypothetical protein